jgi:WhiB family redox-sensing transcriptional regulator
MPSKGQTSERRNVGRPEGKGSRFVFAFVPDTPQWFEHAACRGLDPNIFFAENAGKHNVYVAAIEICHSCPVKQDCLDYAIVTRQEHGMWGGMSERQRRRERKARLDRKIESELELVR